VQYVRGVSILLVIATVSSGCVAGRFRGRVSANDEPTESLASAIGKVREISVRARPKQVIGATIETQDRTLAAALLALSAMPSPEAHRAVAREYERLGIFDAAFRHYQSAVRLDPRDGAAYDGLARLWRDARLPGLALGDAQRAVFYAPRSPEARNTLGTVLQALGLVPDAQQAYESALRLDSSAAYALNNLGYLALVRGDTARAIALLRRAAGTDGNRVVPTNNLALAYEASGQPELARETLRALRSAHEPSTGGTQ
jgi:Flp pilus assembly protein TadD